MGDHNRRAALQQPLQVGLEGGFSGGIEEGRGLIHHQHRWVADPHPGDREQLAFARREVAAPLAQGAFKALG